jgi:hypothetical protein
MGVKIGATLSSDPKLVIAFVVLFCSAAALIYWNFFVKYPYSMDWKQGNRRGRNRNIVKFVVVMFPLTFAVQYIRFQSILDALTSAAGYMVVFSLLAGNLVMVTDVSDLISSDILEHAQIDRIQEALKSNWTNTAIIAALLFSIVVGYGFPLDPELRVRELPGGQFFEAKYGERSNRSLGYAFFACICFSFVEYLVTMLLASLHLMYTEAPSAEGMAQYYKDNPLAPAAPLVWLFCGAFWHLIATQILFFYAHYEVAWGFTFSVLLGFGYLGQEVYHVSKWAPTNAATRWKKFVMNVIILERMQPGQKWPDRNKGGMSPLRGFRTSTIVGMAARRAAALEGNKYAGSRTRVEPLENHSGSDGESRVDSPSCPEQPWASVTPSAVSIWNGASPLSAGADQMEEGGDSARGGDSGEQSNLIQETSCAKIHAAEAA